MYQQPLFAVCELFRRQTKVQRCMILADQILIGKINGKDVNEVIIDLGSTHSLVDWACACKLGLHVEKRAKFHIELANGQLGNPKGITDSCHFTLAHMSIDVKCYIVDV